LVKKRDLVGCYFFWFKIMWCIVCQLHVDSKKWKLMCFPPI
jgi:hypothetical protein